MALLDREQENMYILTVQAMDSAVNPRSSTTEVHNTNLYVCTYVMVTCMYMCHALVTCAYMHVSCPDNMCHACTLYTAQSISH